MRVLFILLAVCINTIASAQEYAKILNHKTTYDIKSSSAVELSESYSIQINSKEGYYFAVYQDYYDEFKTIKSVNIVVKDQHGKKVKRFTKSDMTTYGYSASYEINDSKRVYIDPDYHNYPFVIDVEVESKYSGYTALPVWNPVPYFNIAVDRSELEVLVSNEIDIKVKNQNIEPQSEEATADGTRKVYVVTSLPHVDKKVRYKEFYASQPKVHISPLKFELDGVEGSNESWASFGDWFYQLNNNAYVLNTDTKSFIDKLPKENKEETIREIYKHMQNRVRYISIQLGIGGFKSATTEFTESNGYGDCKALTTYMKNMLDYAEIPSNYILVRAGDDVPDVMADFPGNQFNHVFLGVPMASDTLYLECTSQIVPAGYIGTFTDDRNVLWISQDQSQIIRTKKHSYDENVETNKATVTLEDSGDGSIELKTSKSGALFDDIMPYRYGKEDYIQRKNLGEFSYKDFSIKSFSFDQPDQDKPVFNKEYVLDINGIGKNVADRMILPSNLLKPAADYVDFDEYFHYAEILRGFTVEDVVHISSPQQYWPAGIPKNVDLTSEFGEFHLSYEASEEGLQVKRMFFFKKGKYTQERFEAFHEFMKQVEKAEKQKLILNSKT